jgi:hypothetical protein
MSVLPPNPPALRLSLNREREGSFQLFQFASLLGREFIGTELDLDLFKRASKFADTKRAPPQEEEKGAPRLIW